MRASESGDHREQHERLVCLRSFAERCTECDERAEERYQQHIAVQTIDAYSAVIWPAVVLPSR